MKTIVMSLGGSLIAPDGIDINFLKKFKKLILDYIKKGNRVILVCGGGNTARYYQKSARDINPKVSRDDLDWVGIGATKLNAELVSAIFGDTAYESILNDPTKKISTKRKIIVGAGFKPGSSSDKDAVLAAITFGAKTVINLSNISYVYDKNPLQYKNAKPQKKLSWRKFLKIVGNKYVPGAHWPFDPVASKLAYKSDIDLIVMKGTNLSNLKKFLENKAYSGTLIS